MVNIKQKLYRLSIPKRLRIVFLPILIISILLLTVVASNITRAIITNNATNDILHNLELISMHIETLGKEAESCANTTLINVDYFATAQKFNTQKIEDIQNLIIALKKSKILFNRIDEIHFVDGQGNYISESTAINMPVYGNIATEELFEKITSFNEKGGWISVHKKEFLSAKPEEFFLTHVKKLREIESAEELGYAVLNINEKHIYDIYKDIKPIESLSYKIIDGNNRIISSTERVDIGKHFDIEDFPLLKNRKNNQRMYKGEKVLINSQSIFNTNWKVISIISLDILTEDVEKMTMILISIGCLICFIAFFITIKLSSTITSPLHDLTSHIKNLTDGKLVKFNFDHRNDEIGLLNDNFNLLIDRNRDLVKAIDAKEKKKREYELALLQAQIKPHFLYNTLDIICRLAALDRKKEVIQATKNIAGFYRLALSKGDEIISLERELSLVSKYLQIQQLRYSDILDFKINSIADIDSYTVPKFTLQPLVENAIYHGLKESRKRGQITISGYHEDDYLVIKVSDNGIGMDQNRIKNIFSRNSDMVLTKSYGIINIDERLKLYYGANYGLEIESKPNVGTTVSVKICGNRDNRNNV